ncbi:MAG: hypothetical protein GY795_10035 [Desulfobacterales bacterium]|nr:hypothetical protein [Desulfobacterales bacterium]
MQKKVQVVECVKVMLNDPLFRDNHRTGSGFFTRNRKLTFVIVILLILQKSLKSQRVFRKTGRTFGHCHCKCIHTGRGQAVPYSFHRTEPESGRDILQRQKL